MSNCQITIKINDIFPKIDSLSYDDCKCLISIRNYTSEIYLSNYMNEFFNHQPKIISNPKNIIMFWALIINNISHENPNI